MDRFFKWLYKSSTFSDCADVFKMDKNFSIFEKILLIIIFFLITYIAVFIFLYGIFFFIYSFEAAIVTDNYVKICQDLDLNKWQYIWQGAFAHSLVIFILLFLIWDVIIPILYFTYTGIKLIFNKFRT